jgi:hypothetical protein
MHTAIWAHFYIHVAVVLQITMLCMSSKFIELEPLIGISFEASAQAGFKMSPYNNVVSSYIDA